MCGGTRKITRESGSQVGLSPRVRGNRRGFVLHPAPERSIPACAGEPLSVAGQGASEQVYPRVCGGTPVLVGVGHDCPGLSPRVRGNLATSHYSSGRDRSIPACAGEPRKAITEDGG